MMFSGSICTQVNNRCVCIDSSKYYYRLVILPATHAQKQYALHCVVVAQMQIQGA